MLNKNYHTVWVMGSVEFRYIISSTSNQIDKPIVLVQWEDAKQFFDPWTCKPNAWPCEIGIVFSNSSFSSSKSTKALPKVSKNYHMVILKMIEYIYPLSIIIELKISIFY